MNSTTYLKICRIMMVTFLNVEQMEFRTNFLNVREKTLEVEWGLNGCCKFSASRNWESINII